MKAYQTHSSIGEINKNVSICVKLALSYLQPKSLCLLVPRDHHFCQEINCSIHLATGATRNNPGCERGFANSNNVSRKKVGKWLFFMKHLVGTFEWLYRL